MVARPARSSEQTFHKRGRLVGSWPIGHVSRARCSGNWARMAHPSRVNGRVGILSRRKRPTDSGRERHECADLLRMDPISSHRKAHDRVVQHLFKSQFDKGRDGHALFPPAAPSTLDPANRSKRIQNSWPGGLRHRDPPVANLPLPGHEPAAKRMSGLGGLNNGGCPTRCRGPSATLSRLRPPDLRAAGPLHRGAGERARSRGVGRPPARR